MLHEIVGLDILSWIRCLDLCTLAMLTISSGTGDVAIFLDAAQEEHGSERGIHGVGSVNLSPAVVVRPAALLLFVPLHELG